MGGYGVGVGIGDAMKSVAGAIIKRNDRQYAETTDQADKLMDQMKAVAGKVPRDAQGNPDTNHPQYAKQQEEFNKLHDQYSKLFPNPGAMARHLGKKQRAHVDPSFQGEIAAAPVPNSASTDKVDEHQRTQEGDAAFRTKQADTLKLQGRDRQYYILTGKLPPINLTSLLSQGYKINEDGEPEPMSPDELSPLQKEKIETEQIQNQLRESMIALNKFKNDPNSPAFKLANQRLQVARERTRVMKGNAALRRMDYEAKYLGTMNGQPLPGGPVDPTTGKPMGTTIAKIMQPTTTTRGKAEQAQVVVSSGQELIDKIQLARDVLGAFSGRISSMEVGIGSADHVIADLYASMKSFAALQPALHGARGIGMMKEFEEASAHFSDNPDAAIEKVYSLMNQAKNFVSVGAPQKLGDIKKKLSDAKKSPNERSKEPSYSPSEIMDIIEKAKGQ